MSQQWCSSVGKNSWRTVVHSNNSTNIVLIILIIVLTRRIQPFNLLSAVCNSSFRKRKFFRVVPGAVIAFLISAPIAIVPASATAAAAVANGVLPSLMPRDQMPLHKYFHSSTGKNRHVSPRTDSTDSMVLFALRLLINLASAAALTWTHSIVNVILGSRLHRGSTDCTPATFTVTASDKPEKRTLHLCVQAAYWQRVERAHSWWWCPYSVLYRYDTGQAAAVAGLCTKCLVSEEPLKLQAKMMQTLCSQLMACDAAWEWHMGVCSRRLLPEMFLPWMKSTLMTYIDLKWFNLKVMLKDWTQLMNWEEKMK